MSSGIPELVEFMRIFPGVAPAILQSHRRNERGEFTGCCLGTQFVRFPCVLVLSAREVLPSSAGDQR